MTGEAPSLTFIPQVIDLDPGAGTFGLRLFAQAVAPGPAPSEFLLWLYFTTGLTLLPPNGLRSRGLQRATIPALTQGNPSIPLRLKWYEYEWRERLPLFVEAGSRLVFADALVIQIDPDPRELKALICCVAAPGRLFGELYQYDSNQRIFVRLDRPFDLLANPKHAPLEDQTRPYSREELES